MIQRLKRQDLTLRVMALLFNGTLLLLFLIKSDMTSYIRTSLSFVLKQALECGQLNERGFCALRLRLPGLTQTEGKGLRRLQKQAQSVTAALKNRFQPSKMSSSSWNWLLVFTIAITFSQAKGTYYYGYDPGKFLHFPLFFPFDLSTPVSLFLQNNYEIKYGFLVKHILRKFFIVKISKMTYTYSQLFFCVQLFIK